MTPPGIGFVCRAALCGLLAVLALRTSALAQRPRDAARFPAGLCQRIGVLDGARIASLHDEIRRAAEISACVHPLERLARRGGYPPPVRSGDSFEARLLPAGILAVDRTAYPSDRNNGALWEGVGVSSSLSAGIQLRAPFVTVSLRPELLYQENRDFDVRTATWTGRSRFASPYYRSIDLPQRFGEKAEWRLVPGESYARIDIAWGAAGLSTESLWRGPALRYPIVMSSTAGGFPHLFVGSSRGVDIGIGRVHGEVVWGRLTESDYFDEVTTNDATGLVNVVGLFEPTWLDGLSVGATRSFQYRGDTKGLAPLLRTLGIATTRNRIGNELASIFARWTFPASGTEVYGEWARDDVLGELAEFFQEPDHSQAYLFGIHTIAAVSEILSLRMHGEIANLGERGEERPNSRPLTIFYTNAQVRQGYTHRGQLLGAAVGPGGDAQYVALDALFAHGSLGAYGERVRRNDQIREATRFPDHGDTELTAGVRGLLLRGALAIGADVSRSLRLNRDFRGNDLSWRTEIQLHWSPGLEPLP